MTTNFENENSDNSENTNETNEFSEIEEMEPLDQSSPKSGALGNIAEAWHTNPLVKFTALVVGVFAVGAAAIKFFGNSDASKEVAHLARPPAIKEAPGGAASPYHRQQTELANNERIQRALDTNGSAIPTPIGQASEVSNNNSLGKEADPMKELRAETDQLRRQVQQQQQQAVQQRRGDGFDNSLAEAMQRQLTQLMSSWQATGMKAVTVSTKDDKGVAGRGGGGDAIVGGGGDIPSGANGGGGSTVAAEQKPLVPAGTVSYAQLLSEANSDVPGPILAQIVSGPLTGARAIGAFQVADGYEKYLVMKFSLADRNGKDYPINAIALDPETTLGGMATEVDERYFTRVVLPAAASFIQGVGQAMGQGGTSITTNGSVTITTQAESGFKQGMYSGLGQAANTVGQFFQQQANLTKPLVRVAPGTPFGMFFLAAVRDSKAAAAQPTDMSGGYNVNYAPGEMDYSGASGASYQNGPYTGTNNGYNSGRLTSGRSNLPYVHQQNY